LLCCTIHDTTFPIIVKQDIRTLVNFFVIQIQLASLSRNSVGIHGESRISSPS
jgi:hypothetical protein